MLSHYLCIGLGVYAAASILNRDTFNGSDWRAIGRGLILGLLLWPVALGLLWFFKFEPRSKKE